MSDMFITSNIVLKLLPGRHVLTNTFIVKNIENFTIEGLIETENSPYPVVQYTAENYSMALRLFYTRFIWFTEILSQC